MNDNMRYDAEGGYYTSKFSDRDIYIKCDDLTLGDLMMKIYEASKHRWPEIQMGAASQLRFNLFSENTRGCGCHPEPGDYEQFIAISKIT